MTLYLRVGESTLLTTGSTRILGESGKKSTHIEICKKKFNQIRDKPDWLANSNPF